MLRCTYSKDVDEFLDWVFASSESVVRSCELYRALEHSPGLQGAAGQD